MTTAPLRVVHDTSVIRPILLPADPDRRANPDAHWLVQLWQSGTVIPIANSATLNELDTNLQAASRNPHIGAARAFAAKMMAPYREHIHELPYQNLTHTPRCRHTKDQKFVNLAYYSNADYLLAEDHDLLTMADLVPFPILTLEQFQAILN